MNIPVKEFKQSDRRRAYVTPCSQDLGRLLSQDVPMARERNEPGKDKGKGRGQKKRRRKDTRNTEVFGYPSRFNGTNWYYTPYENKGRWQIWYNSRFGTTADFS